MKRFWILLKTEFTTWRHEPITAMGGFIPPVILFIAFAVLFGGNLGFKVAVINHDQGEYGAELIETMQTVISPLGNKPYYRVQELEENQAWAAYEAYRLEGIWVIPADFSKGINSGETAKVEMYFSNYNDDRAKNHRIYSAEILWAFYEKIGVKAPSFDLEESYPRDVMIEWSPVIGVGLVLFSATLGGMLNIFMLTHKEQTSGLLLEIGAAPRSLLPYLGAKIILALVMSILTGTIMLGVLYLWMGQWLAVHLEMVWLLMGLVALFWIMAALVLGLKLKQYMSGAVILILSGIIIFFTGGGLSLIRTREAEVMWWNWLIPNIYALDALRDLLLFESIPADWQMVLLILSGFAVFALILGLFATNRILRRPIG